MYMRRVSAAFGLALWTACADDTGVQGGAAPEAQVGEVPTEAEALEAWLAAGSYKSWSCEDAVHASRSPSPHGFNRICSNMQVDEARVGDGPWPKGAAAVKELYRSADDTEPMGYAVELKVADDSAGGAGWYWYERIGTDAVADGLGDSGAPKSICVSCHTAAGSDAAHTPTEYGRDFVYTPVP
jgi:Cytochrome P460